ncbi:MAG: hypothetical protein ABJF04_25735 [Reichenbachiella sp.]|uniref:hypothetical protein n=1 Tax=Reichenbachiella sp. TaxID=2184521 RepID=UPI003264F824
MVIYLSAELEERKVPEMIEGLSDIFQKDESQIVVYQFNAFGIKNYTDSFVEDIKYAGIKTIISKRRAVLQSDASFHYELPSKKHSSFLIRTANILSCNEEIYFLSLCLLDHLEEKNYDYIACDSSSIMHLGFGLKYIKSIFNVFWEIPIESFYSYQFKEDNYSFKPNSLVIISASNSGDLEDEILKQTENDIDIITVLLNVENPIERQFLFNLNDEIEAIFGSYEATILYNKDDCDLCNQNSVYVNVHSEQFLPSKCPINPVVLTVNHLPKWLNDAIPDLCLQSGISCFRGENLDQKRRDVYLDVELLVHNGSPFKEKLEHHLNNEIDCVPDAIVTFGDSGSNALAYEIYGFYGSKADNELPAPIQVHELEKLDQNGSLNIFIVSACLTTGNRFLSASKDLRAFRYSSLYYFTVFSRLPNAKNFQILKSNLKFRNENKDTCKNSFHSFYHGFLPDVHSSKRLKTQIPTWETEIKFWRKQNDQPPFIKKRIEELARVEGLVDNLFFSNPFNGESLKLRPNFALFSLNKNQHLNQASVYFLISALLHNSRHPFGRKKKNKNLEYFITREGSKSIISIISTLLNYTKHSIRRVKRDKKLEYLINHEHSRSIISIECFRRYNDGVIQAAILRAAHPVELDYSCDQEHSSTSLKVLKDLFKKEDNTRDNEALLEFLYSMAIGKLKLIQEDMSEFVSYIRAKYSSIDEIVYMLDLIDKNIRGAEGEEQLNN